MLSPVHPGEILNEEFMSPYGLSANALARAIRVPPNRVAAIVNGTRGVTADTALRLARMFDTTPGFWLNLQNTYDLDVAMSNFPEDINAGSIESKESVVKHLIDLALDLFNDRDCLSFERKPDRFDLIVHLDWNLNSDPARPSKRSRGVEIKFDGGLLNDYRQASQQVQAMVDETIRERIRTELISFEPEHDAPSNAIPPSEPWIIGSDIIRY